MRIESGVSITAPYDILYHTGNQLYFYILVFIMKTHIVENISPERYHTLTYQLSVGEHFMWHWPNALLKLKLCIGGRSDGSQPRYHYDEQICGGEVRKIEKRSCRCTVERGGTGDLMLVTGVREGWGRQWNISFPSRVSRVVCISLELRQIHNQTPNTLPTYGIALALGNDGSPRWGIVSLSW